MLSYYRPNQILVIYTLVINMTILEKSQDKLKKSDKAAKMYAFESVYDKYICLESEIERPSIKCIGAPKKSQLAKSSGKIYTTWWEPIHTKNSWCLGGETYLDRAALIWLF